MLFGVWGDSVESQHLREEMRQRAVAKARAKYTVALQVDSVEHLREEMEADP